MKQIYETLCGICGAAHVLVREPMSRHTTFRTGGTGGPSGAAGSRADCTDSRSMSQ